MDVHPDSLTPSATEEEWRDFELDINTFEAQHIHGRAKLAFAFVEGPLVRAIRAGHW
jgi:midasin